ncbi:MAG: amidohydrolase/deacetylase family metallohydrolase [Acidimicrobiia bacterium]|nr:amidohydrolase/deacetylase family metallohydrolase [Acidimicrobiia bacterium]
MSISRRTVLAAPLTLWAQPARYGILIRGGEVVDPSRGFRQRADVATAGDRVVAIEPSLDPSRAGEVIDASGMMVTPGLVDLHTHCHSGLGIGIDADPVAARSGVSTWVDAGTFAHNEIAGFRRFIVTPAKVRIYGYVYLYPNSRNPDVDPVPYVRGMIKATGEAAQKNRDIILGVKFQVGANMNGRYSLEFLKLARELCDRFELPLMAHISFAPPQTDEVMALMKKGDVVTHCFNGHTLGILDESGKVRPSVKEARSRGVLFDIGHGLGSFNFPAARKALDDGFLPDSISTDIYTLNVNGPVYDMPTTMSKLLHLGMKLEDVLLRSTYNPAQVVNRVPGMGTLAVGGPADVALLRLEEGSYTLVDSQKNAVTAKQRLVGRLAVCKGKRITAA